MRKFLVILLFASACGDDKCGESDYTEADLCVITNKHEGINRDQIQWAVDQVEQGVNRHKPGLDLHELLAEIPASLSYVDKLSHLDKTKAGITVGYQNIEVKWGLVIQQTTVGGCAAHTEIVSHEVMHIVAHYYYHASIEKDKIHQVADLFLPEDCPDRSCPSLEAEIWTEIVSYCGQFRHQEGA